MGTININVIAGLTAGTSSVNVSPGTQQPVAASEMASFGIGVDQLYPGVVTYWGEGPTDIYLSDPNPWNLYAGYGWMPVMTNVGINGAVINSVTSEVVVLAAQTFLNDTSLPNQVNVALSQQQPESAANAWSPAVPLTISDTFAYSITFPGTGGANSTVLSYNHTLGETQVESLTATLGSNGSVIVTNPSHSSLTATLTATKVTLNLLITYNVYLNGELAVNYANTWKGHHFWALDISQVMYAAGIPYWFSFNESITLTYYTNAVITTTDQVGIVKTPYMSHAIAGVEKVPAPGVAA